MKVFHRLSPLCFAAIFGCEQMAPPPAPPWDNLPPAREDTIGRLQVDGTRAYLNDTPVTNGAYVRAGDVLATGANTGARVVLNDGGFVQLDQNTDPEFTLIRQGTCVLVKFAHGRGLLTSVKCVEAQAGQLNFVLKSLVNLQTTGEAAQVTVLEGKVEITSPASAFVETFQEYALSSTGATSLVTLTPEQAQATVEWSKRFFRTPSAGNQDGGSPGAVMGGVAIGLGLWEIFHHNSHPSRPPVERPQPPVESPRAPPATPPAAPANPDVRPPPATGTTIPPQGR